MLPVKLFKRDFGGMASVMGAVLLILAAPLASLGEGVGPTVMAVGLLSAAAAPWASSQLWKTSWTTERAG
jgi:hypothetical protein